MKIDWKSCAPAVLSALAVVGVGVTVGLTAKCHELALPEIKKLKEEEPEIKKIEVAKHVWKYYIPVLVGAGATTTLIVLSNRLSAKQLATMTAAATAAIHQKDKIKAKVKEILGSKGFAEIEKAIGDDTAMEMMDKDENHAPNEVIFYDTFTNEAFYATPEVVNDAIYKINRIMAIEASVSLSDFYDLMGKPAPWYAPDYGWSMEYGVGEGLYCWIDIALEKIAENGKVYYRINYTSEPSTAYELDEYKHSSRSAIERAEQVQSL